jgi:hypothetical protein
MKRITHRNQPTFVHQKKDMLNRMFAAAVHGVHALPITIEIDVYGGDFGYTLVGLPDKSVQESRERIAVAFKNNGFQWPRQRVSIPSPLAFYEVQGKFVGHWMNVGW